MSFKLISAILRSPWLIDRSWAMAHLPLIMQLLNGERSDLSFSKKAMDDDDGPRERADKKVLSIQDGVVEASYWRSFNDAPQGSVALIPVCGPIMKYGGECGEPGAIHMNEWTLEAKNSPKISGVLFKIDSPGGQVDGTQTLADTIKNIGKPNFAFIDDGMMASAAMWIGSAANEIYASQLTDEAGSIGVLSTFADFRGWYEQKGIKLHEVYAPQSTDKNLDYRKGIEGDYKLIEDDLKFICAQFIKAVKANRKGKLNLEYDDPFTGKMFKAKDAVEVGLIDGIASIDDLVKELSGKKKPASQTSINENSQNSNTTTMFGRFSKLLAIQNKKAEEVTDEMIDAVNAELTLKGITSVRVISAADFDAAEKLEEQVATQNQKITSLEGEVKRLGNEDGAAAVEVAKQKDKITEDPAAKNNAVIADMPHNKAAAEMLD